MFSLDLVKQTLTEHVGRSRGITAENLALRLAGALEPEELNWATRRLRRMIQDMRMDGVPICGRPGTGYYLAETAADLEDACSFLRARAMTTLAQISRLRRIGLPELLGQMKMELDGGDDGRMVPDGAAV